MGAFSSLSVEELVRRCSASGEIDAWEEFVRRFHRLIATVVLRTAQTLGDASAPTVDDLIQETYLKLCSSNFRLLREFEQRNPDAFVGFVKVVAANVTRDYFKALRSKKRGANLLMDAPDLASLNAPDEGVGNPEAIERRVLLQEIQHFLEICTAGPDQERKQTVFWLYYRAGLSAGAIAALPEVELTTKGVESLILRVTKELREQMTSPTKTEDRRNKNTSEGLLPASSL